MSTRIVKVGRVEQAIFTEVKPGEHPGFTERHEHITLETPKPLTDTQKLRLMTYHEMKQSWSQQ